MVNFKKMSSFASDSLVLSIAHLTFGGPVCTSGIEFFFSVLVKTGLTQITLNHFICLWTGHLFSNKKN